MSIFLHQGPCISDVSLTNISLLLRSKTQADLDDNVNEPLRKLELKGTGAATVKGVEDRPVAAVWESLPIFRWWVNQAPNKMLQKFRFQGGSPLAMSKLITPLLFWSQLSIHGNFFGGPITPFVIRPVPSLSEGVVNIICCLDLLF